MSVIRQNYFLGQERLDVPQLRSTDASVAGDFDVLAGQIISGKEPLVVSGFQVITSNTMGIDASSVQIVTANSLAMHFLASENGTIFNVPADRPIETLNASNPRLSGAFTANTVNFVGFDLRRSADASTSDVVQFLDANTLLETAKRVPLARTLDYVITISTQDFSLTPGVCPIARIMTDANNRVTSIEDARNMFGRLGSGGSVPNATSSYTWPGGRTESTDNSLFNDGDKQIVSLKQWMDAVMTRLWEEGGGEHWYSATADRNVMLVRTGARFPNGEFFSWDGTTLAWQGLSFVFDNSTGFRNDITNSSIALPDGYCLYVDLDRTQNRIAGTNSLTAAIAPMSTLGTPTIPGARWILAWRVGSGNFCIFTRDSSFPVNSSFLPATDTSLGIVKLTYASSVAPAPVVAVVNSSFQAVITGVSRANPGGGSPGPGTLSFGPDTTDDTKLLIGNTASRTFEVGKHSVSTVDVTIGDNVTSLGDFNTTDFGGDFGATLTAAMAALPNSGTTGTIMIKSGTYAAITTVSVTATSLTLIGENDSVVINYSQPILLSLATNSVSIRHLSLVYTGSSPSYAITNSGFSTLNIHDCATITGVLSTGSGILTGMFQNCTFTNSHGSALLSPVSGMRFTKCNFSSLKGAVVQDVVQLGNATQTIFDQCMFSLDSTALANSTCINVVNSTAVTNDLSINNCEFSPGPGVGITCIKIQPVSGGSKSQNIQVIDCSSFSGIPVDTLIQVDKVNGMTIDRCVCTSTGAAGSKVINIGSSIACSNVTVSKTSSFQAAANSPGSIGSSCSFLYVGSTSFGVTVTECNITGHDVGMWLETISHFNISNNVINGAGRGAVGIYTGAGTDAVWTSGNIADNHIENLSDTRFGAIVGIWLDSGVTCLDVNVSNNNVTNFTGGSTSIWGINLNGLTGSGVTNVTIDGNYFSQFITTSTFCAGVGLIGRTFSCNVSNNTMDTMYDGIYFDLHGNSSRMTISGNIVNQFNRGGIYSATNDTHVDLCICDNTVSSVDGTGDSGGAVWGIAILNNINNMTITGNHTYIDTTNVDSGTANHISVISGSISSGGVISNNVMRAGENGFSFGISTDGIKHLVVAGNSFSLADDGGHFGFSGFGIEVVNSQNSTISGNTVFCASATNNFTPFSCAGTSYTTISGNNAFSTNTSANSSGSLTHYYSFNSGSTYLTIVGNMATSAYDTATTVGFDFTGGTASTCQAVGNFFGGTIGHASVFGGGSPNTGLNIVQ